MQEPYYAIRAVALTLAIALATSSTQKLGQLEARFARAGSALERVRILARLGPLEVREARRELDTGKFAEALQRLQQYRDRARQAYEQLHAHVLTPAKKPAGFKELEISLRETLRQLDDAIATAPFEYQNDLKAVRADLNSLHARLLDDLFPSGGGKRK